MNVPSILTRAKARALILVVLFCASLAPAARAELTHGFVDLGRGAFDFSTQTQYADIILGWDYMDIASCVVDPIRLDAERGQSELLEEMFCLWNSTRIRAVPDSTLETITYAPEDAALYYGSGVPPVLGQAYVVKTGDGFYVKFAVRLWPHLIEYYVQMDGSNDLRSDGPLAIETTTWGRVKALYTGR